MNLPTIHALWIGERLGKMPGACLSSFTKQGHSVIIHWGVIGPEAITYYAKQFNIEHLAQKIDIFYPVHYSSVSMLMDTELTISDITTHRTLCIHLYNEMLKNIDLNNLNKNSILFNIIHQELS